MGRSIFWCAVSTFKICCDDPNFTWWTKLIFQNFTCVLTKTWTCWLFVTFCHTQDFCWSMPDGHPMLSGTSFIPLDVLIKCASLCLIFLHLTVHCAAYVAWTTPRLAKTDKTCVKLTCLYQLQVRVYSKKVYTSGFTKTISEWHFGVLKLLVGVLVLSPSCFLLLGGLSFTEKRSLTNALPLASFRLPTWVSCPLEPQLIPWTMPKVERAFS